jgi:1-acyl-sn-glycerol-3-phosphate acyltransferase
MAYIGSPVLALRRVIAFLALTVVAMPLQALAVLVHSRLQKDIPYWYHRQVCRLLGIRVERRGRQSRAHPTLYVCNHISYWDINILGSLIKGSFIAKAEIADWPFFSWLAKLQRSVFIERRASRTAAHRDEMLKRLDAGDDLILFPEGTSSDGNRVLPFKSAFFSVAQYHPHDEPLLVQPVSIAYTRLDGVPMGRYLRPYYAWYGDMDLPGHLWESVGLGRVTVVVEFHKPVTIDEFGSRKALSEHCHQQIRLGLATALGGRARRKALKDGEQAPKSANVVTG